MNFNIVMIKLEEASHGHVHNLRKELLELTPDPELPEAEEI